ncbi:hypothetical protein [Brevundimonas naejangsanensis]|uniref:hypothetical protein n=1 Tax=Brevundimonas naejangsanensis TaxID=588932 RepID=UPI0025D0687A|nr:hypothetical protein [Brevundimonas naejangsanensis]
MTTPASGEDLPEDLRSTGVDLGVALSKGLLGVIPNLGGFLAELVGAVVPEQRADRFARYLAKVDANLKALEARIDIADARKLTVEQIALFETGGAAAVKAFADSQLDRIAILVAQGLTADAAEAARARRELLLISELTDEDIIELCSQVEPYKSDEDWLTLHGDILWTYAHFKRAREEGMAPEELQRRDVDAQLRESRLVSLGLIQQSPSLDLDDLTERIATTADGSGEVRRKHRSGEGEIRLSYFHTEITVLGRLVLERLELWTRPSRSTP